MKQAGGSNRRPWFQNDGRELIIWSGPGDAPVGFQICYLSPDRRERTPTWRPASGLTPAQVDSGDTRPDKNLTPFLMKDGAVPRALVSGEFEQ